MACALVSPTRVFTSCRARAGRLARYHNRFYESVTGVEAVEGMYAQVSDIIEAWGDQRDDLSVALLPNRGFVQPNLIARIEGYDNGGDVVIVGAHIDSINSEGPRVGWPLARAPGADDDGSGSAVVFEAFRVIAASGFRPARTLEFHW